METLTPEERAARRAERRAKRNAAKDDEKKFTILYVDDEMPNLRGFKSTFRRLYKVLTAIGPEEAFEVVQKEHIDLIVTDHRMPHMSGVELLKDVHSYNPKIKRMILSGFIKRADLNKTIGDFGIHDFVTKPWDFENLNGIFQRILTTDADVKDFSKLG